MTLTLILAPMVLVALAVLAAQAQDQPNPVLEPIPDAPGLPRVLLIGDSISMDYTLPVRELLKGKANVHRVPDNAGATTQGLAKLDAWLGKSKWDVIHFNFGLHDLKYVGRRGQLSDPTRGKQLVPVDQYEKNLRQLVGRLKATGATLAWATTTPVPAGAAGRVPDDAVRYNAAAAKVMQEHGVIVNDLYALVLPRLKDFQLPNNVHFKPEGSQAMAQQVAKVILEAIKPAAKK